MIYENEDGYFEWMVDLVCGRRFAKTVSFRRVLSLLHETEFTYLIHRDMSRAEDGIALRYRFSRLNDPRYYDMPAYLDGPCSVLEMMVALAIKCEENITADPDIGDRTGQWFWAMLTNLGLGSMTDDRFDRNYGEYILERFLNREYEPDGKGGLFTVKHCDCDLRTVEIWYQMCWYLDSIM